MKLKNSILIIFLCLFSIGFSQTDFKDVYKDSKSCHNSLRINVPAWSFKWCVLDEELHDALSGVKKVSLIVMENSNDDFLRTLTEFNSNVDYEDVVIVREDDVSFRVKVNLEKEVIRELVILVKEERESVFFSMRGKMEKKELQSLIEVAQKQL